MVVLWGIVVDGIWMMAIVMVKWLVDVEGIMREIHYQTERRERGELCTTREKRASGGGVGYKRDGGEEEGRGGREEK